MTEDEAQEWLRAVLAVSRETLDRLDIYRRMVIAEALQQNLVAASTIDRFWARHIVDSAQLLPLARASLRNRSSAAGGGDNGPWLDLGSGAGLPGIVLAILNAAPIHLVESRTRRVGFLANVCAELGLSHATVYGRRLETLDLPFMSVITARAFAPLPKLLQTAQRFSTKKTLWLLPKGVSARSEVESIRGTWQGLFHVEQSLTDPAAAIIVASGIKKSGTR